MAPSALEWYTCTSTWPFVSSATSCLNFSALRPHACSLELGDENLSTYFGCAAALMASAARTITASTLASIFRMGISLWVSGNCVAPEHYHEQPSRAHAWP